MCATSNDGIFIPQTGAEGELSLKAPERLDSSNLDAAIFEFAKRLASGQPKSVKLDLSELLYLDTAGALALNQMNQAARKAGAEFSISGQSPKAQSIMSLVDPKALAAPSLIPEKQLPGLVTQVGQASVEIYQDMLSLIAFLGDVIIALFRVIRNPKELRLADTIYYMQAVGVDGLAIVGLIGFLMGLIMAFMSSLQLSLFGADIYVAALVSAAMVRELGPIMAAILVAGRSGSSFAAEIGTMKVNEEVDALEVMGFEAVSFLALPKIVATILVLPILTLYADVLAIFGGMLVGVLGLDITPYAYIQQTFKAINVFAVTTGILKAAVFALIIAGIGCHRGFKVRGGAQAVGDATTSAVVTAMFWIIVADSVFAILLYYVD